MRTRNGWELVVRDDCELCAVLHELIAADGRVRESELEIVDLESHPELLERYLYRIPVLRRAGREICWGRVEADELKATLDREFASS